MKFSTGSYSTAGKRGHWPASKDISLSYLTLPHITTHLVVVVVVGAISLKCY